MKKIVLLLTIAFIFIKCDIVVSNRVAIVCVYDYKEAFKLGKNSSVKDGKQPIYYLSAESDSIDYDIIEYENFEQMFCSVQNRDNMLLYIHGNGYNIDHLMSSSDSLSQLYNTDVIAFAWASEENPYNSIRNYRNARENVKLSIPRFAETMDSLNLLINREGINCAVLFHSLGNLFAKYYAHYLINYPSNLTSVNNMVINAACVYEQDHNIWIDVLVRNVKNKVYVTRNSKDRILNAAAEFVENGKLLGEADIKYPSNNVIYVDFTDIIREDENFGTSHAYFAEELPLLIPAIKQFYYSIIHNESVELDNTSKFERGDFPNYFIIKSTEIDYND